MLKILNFKESIMLVFITTSMVLSSAVFALGLPESIRVDIDLASNEFDVDDKLLVKVSYTNVSDVSVTLLLWETMLEGGITHDYFEIRLNDRRIPYTGIHVKRAVPQEQHFITLAPGEIVSAWVDLSYGYSLTEVGEYTLNYADNHGHKHIDAKKANATTFKLMTERPVTLLKRVPIFESCSANQQSQIDEALSAAESIAIQAASDLNNAPVAERPNARRYREWFGAYTPARYETVRQNMSSIASALRNERIGFDCNCTGRPEIDPYFTFAFVSPGDAYNMTLCGAFWRARLTGTDSRSGTIVHELSHFTIVAGTVDFRPNQAGIRSLARDEPQEAIRAANAYEYFAENTPFLSMPAAESVPSPGQPSSSDIELSQVSVSDESFAANAVAKIQGVISNQGIVAIRSIKITAYLSADASISSRDAEIGNTSISSLNGASNTTFSLDGDIPDQEGVRYIGVCATATSSEGAKEACSTSVEVKVVDGIVIAPIIQLLLDG